MSCGEKNWTSSTNMNCVPRFGLYVSRFCNARALVFIPMRDTISVSESRLSIYCLMASHLLLVRLKLKAFIPNIADLDADITP